MRKTNVILAACMMLTTAASAQAANINVVTRNSQGQPLPGVAVTLVTSQFTPKGVTDANGELQINVPSNTNYKLKVTYNNTTYQSPAYKVAQGAMHDTFKTSELIVKAENCGTGINGVGLSYVDATNSYTQMGATWLNGTKSVEVFPRDSMKVRAVSSGSMSDYYLYPFPYGTVSANVTFNLTKVTLPGVSLLVGSSWVPGGSGIYLFPNKYKVRINNTYDDSVTVAGCDVSKVPVILIVKDHNNQPIAGVKFRGGYNAIQWHVADATNAQGVAIEWTTGNAITNRIYEATVNVSKSTKTQNTAANGGNVFTFKTGQLVVNLQDCNGVGLAGGHVRYGINGIQAHFPNGAGVNTDANGVTSAELFPGVYTLEMGINSTTQTKVLNFTGTESETFKTTKVINNFGYPSKLAIGGTWINANIELLPGTWQFRFSTPSFVYHNITIGGCTQAVNLPAPAQAKSTAIEVISTPEFEFYPNPASANITINMASAGDVVIMSLTGQKVAKFAAEKGLNRFDISTLPSGNYMIIANGTAQKLTKE